MGQKWVTNPDEITVGDTAVTVLGEQLGRQGFKLSVGAAGGIYYRMCDTADGEAENADVATSADHPLEAGGSETYIGNLTPSNRISVISQGTDTTVSISWVLA